MIAEHYQKLCRGIGVVLELHSLFSKKLHSVHKQREAKKFYDELFMPYLHDAFCVALSPNGKVVDTEQFAQFMANKSLIHCFVGGAYGLSHEFQAACHQNFSLSPLTFSHKIAHIVLCEQIYRAMSILCHHPYHK
ncbi:23S rRNA (pseudouridine(1915)-N(3))-methyltransferase RlmH [Helicobacter monodelphidis]|uniref:23S rRNA (pseudouridine(1915)-N(3))-methyltransferase RlmH n=1 Tax=Helicobacter sp. 15-1451 TaxID=2004995 RepID=UPI00215CA741|nr:23S rRNA (pseudouridine(1915)-N(3))-methyltransferase RlmH [Helicobacter sp. 15-1451]